MSFCFHTNGFTYFEQMDEHMNMPGNTETKNKVKKMKNARKPGYDKCLLPYFWGKNVFNTSQTSTIHTMCFVESSVCICACRRGCFLVPRCLACLNSLQLPESSLCNSVSYFMKRSSASACHPRHRTEKTKKHL